MKYKKLQKTLEEIFNNDAVPVQYLLLYIENWYEIWRKNEKSKK